MQAVIFAIDGHCGFEGLNFSSLECAAQRQKFKKLQKFRARASRILTGDTNF